MHCKNKSTAVKRKTGGHGIFLSGKELTKGIYLREKINIPKKQEEINEDKKVSTSHIHSKNTQCENYDAVGTARAHNFI